MNIHNWSGEHWARSKAWTAKGRDLSDGYFTRRGYSLALWKSADGIDWKLAKHPFVANPSTIHWTDGHAEKLEALERPQVLQEDGWPVARF